MKHRVFGNQLGRRTNDVKALYRSLLNEVFEHERIETSLAKAKAIQADIDHIINWAKGGSINDRRQIIKTLGNEKKLEMIFAKMAKRFSDRNSGYSRIIRLGTRISDTTEMVLLELVDFKPIEKLVKVDKASEVKPLPEVKEEKDVKEEKAKEGKITEAKIVQKPVKKEKAKMKAVKTVKRTGTK